MEQVIRLREDGILFFIPGPVGPGELFMELCPTGDIFIRGKHVTNDIEVVEGMRQLIRLHGIVNVDWNEGHAQTVTVGSDSDSDLEWESILDAPKDGGPVYVKRVYKDQLIKEGVAVFAPRAANAPARKGMPPDPLGRPWPIETQAERDAHCDEPAWVEQDRMYLFPEPTHWCPAKTKELRMIKELI